MAEEDIVAVYRLEIDKLKGDVSELRKQFGIVEASAKKATDAAGQGAKHAAEEMSGLGKEAERISDRFRSLAERVVAAFAVERIIHFGEEAVDAFAKSEKSALQLLGALQGNAPAQERLLKFAEELSVRLAIPPAVINSQSAFLAVQGRSEAQIKKIINAATELAAVKPELGLEGAVRILDATLEGNIGKLGKLDAKIRDTSQVERENGAVIDLVAEKYKGFAEKGLAGVQGELQRTQVEIEETTIRIGEQIAPAKVFAAKYASAWLEGLGLIFQGAKDLVDKNRSVLLNPFGLFRKTTTDEEDAKNQRDAVATQQEALTKIYAQADKETLDQLKADAQLRLQTAKGAQRIYFEAEVAAAEDLLRQAEDRDRRLAERSTITLEHLKQQVANLQAELERVENPLTTGKAQQAKILAEIAAREKQIDEITGASAKERAKKQAEALKEADKLRTDAGADELNALAKLDAQRLEQEQQNIEAILEAKHQGFIKEQQQALANKIAQNKQTFKDAGVTKFSTVTDSTTNQKITIAVEGDRKAVEDFNTFVIHEENATDAIIRTNRLKTDQEIAKERKKLNENNAKEDLAATLQNIDLTKTKEILALTEAAKEKANRGKADSEKLAEDIMQKELQAEALKNEEILKSSASTDAEKLKAAQAFIEAKIKLNEKEVSDEEKQQRRLQALHREELDLINQIGDASADVFSNIAKSNEDNVNAQLAANQAAQDQETADLKAQFDERIIGQAEYEKRSKELKDKRVGNERALQSQLNKIRQREDIIAKGRAVFDIGLKTAQAIMDILSKEAGNPIAAGILITLTSALAASELAATLALQPPKYHEGVSFVRADGKRWPGIKMKKDEKVALLKHGERVTDPETNRKHYELFEAIEAGTLDKLIYHRFTAPALARQQRAFEKEKSRMLGKNISESFVTMTAGSDGVTEKTFRKLWSRGISIKNFPEAEDRLDNPWRR